MALTSVLAKLLECIVRNWVLPCLEENGVSHTTQSANVSCEDVYVTKEMIARYVGGGDHAHLCSYDLVTLWSTPCGLTNWCQWQMLEADQKQV